MNQKEGNEFFPISAMSEEELEKGRIINEKKFQEGGEFFSLKKVTVEEFEKLTWKEQVKHVEDNLNMNYLKNYMIQQNMLESIKRKKIARKALKDKKMLEKSLNKK